MNEPPPNQPPQSPAPVQSAVPLPPKKNSGLLIGILLLLLGILVGLTLGKTTLLSNLHIPYFSATPTSTPIPSPTPTANLSRAESKDWKTYTNGATGYSLKYPPTWQVIESNQLLGVGEISDTKWNLSTTNDVPNIRIVVYKSDSNFAKSITPGGTQSVVGGKTATKNTTEGHTFTTDYLVTNATNTYFIDLEVASKQESSQYEPVFDQILSTFRFTSGGGEGQFCGGFAGTLCPEGYECQLEGDYPDAGGVCIKN